MELQRYKGTMFRDRQEPATLHANSTNACGSRQSESVARFHATDILGGGLKSYDITSDGHGRENGV
jgi:hypothetical protein